MNILVKNKDIEVCVQGYNFSYVLNNNMLFAPTEYKVLQSQSEKGLLRCMRILYNGKIQLYYLTNEFNALSEIITELDSKELIVVLKNLFRSIEEIENIGFLTLRNIDVDLDHIYIDSSTNKVYLMYLPLAKKLHKDYFTFSMELRNNLITHIKNSNMMDSNIVNNLLDKLSNASLSLTDLLIKLDNLDMEDNEFEDSRNNKSVKLVSLNSSMKVEFDINKNEFILGKKESEVDGWIYYNFTVSRIHCVIKLEKGNVTITDLKSKNGTYLNGKRLEPNESNSLNNGDIVSLSNSEFRICIE